MTTSLLDLLANMWQAEWDEWLLFSCSVMSDSLWFHGLQYAMHPCPSLYPGVCSNLCSSSQWCLPTTSSSVALCSSCPQSFPASGSFPIYWHLASCGQSIGASASAPVLPINIQGWFPLELTGLISLLSKGLSRVFSRTTVWKHQFFSVHPSYCLTLISVHYYWKNRDYWKMSVFIPIPKKGNVAE